MKHNNELALAAAKRIAEIWGTQLLTDNPELTSSLVNILSPCQDVPKVRQIMFDMLKEDNCWPIFDVFNGVIYCRISCQIYNQMEDYEFMAHTFLKHVQRSG